MYAIFFFAFLTSTDLVANLMKIKIAEFEFFVFETQRRFMEGAAALE